MNREELKKALTPYLHKDYDTYKCDETGHLILIEASQEKNEAENTIRCPYHKCLAECESTMDKILPADEVIELIQSYKDEVKQLKTVVDEVNGGKKQ